MTELNYQELRNHWEESNIELKYSLLRSLPFEEAQEFFHLLRSDEQLDFISPLEANERRKWLFILPLDDTADLLQNLEPEERAEYIELLPEKTKREIQGLLAYAEDVAGGIMNPKYVTIKDTMTVEEAMSYIREQAKTTMEIIYYAYVVDQNEVLSGVLSFRDILVSPSGKRVRDIMETDVISVTEQTDQESISKIFAKSNLFAIPVVNEQNQMKGIITFDDVATAIEEEATEDIQRIGGMEALDMPYWSTHFKTMIKKRAGWLTVLFFGEMFTATAMAHYEHDISKAVILAMFIPLIISSGGNSGSQASTLIIRALALQEVKIKDWLRVFYREFASGLALGLILGVIGFLRIVGWQMISPIYGDHYILLAMTVSLSLVGIVLWGTLSGSMLPFVLKKLGFDPASASAPFVATLVDVTGLMIYFTIAHAFLQGTLL